MDRKKVILGTFGPDATRKIGRYYSGLHVRVEVEIQDKGDGKQRLSISGDTYYPGARDIESGGQILDEVRRLLDDPAASLEMPRAKIARLLEVWERWHLNDMRPACEHQRATWDTSKKITLVTYQKTTAVFQKVRAIERGALEQLSSGLRIQYSAEERRLTALPWTITRGAEQAAPGPEYEEEKREEKIAGWVHPEEHPDGVLSKPCPVCGYKYGTAWLYEPLPADVIAFLEDFVSHGAARG